MHHAAIDGSSANAQLTKMVHLVLHQGDEWGDDDADTLLCQCRHLEGDTLAAARRHQSQRVVPAGDGVDDFALNAAEVIVAPVLLENLPIALHSA